MESQFLKRLQKLGVQVEISVNMTADMIEFLNSAGLTISDDDIPDYFDVIDRALVSDRQCKACKGIEQCKSDAEGMQYVIEMGPTGKILPSYRMCKFKQLAVVNKRVERLLSSSRLPELFKCKTFDNFKRSNNQEAFMAAQRVANDAEGKGVLFYGPPGTGKTHLAAAIVNARLAQGMQAVFVTVPDLLADIRETIGKGNETSELLEVVKDVDLLVMDDMGTERITQWVSEQLFSVINARLMRKKQTVVTTNYTPSELISRMAVRDRNGKIEDDLPGHRIVSRLSEMCQKVEMRGRDQRLNDGRPVA